MKIRRFYAKDMRTALNEVSRELGSDAAILSSRRVDGGVELLAAQDYEPGMLETMSDVQREQEAFDAEKEKPAPRSGRFATEVNNDEKRVLQLDWGNDPELKSIKDEMRQLRSLMEEQIQGLAWKEMQQRKPVKSLLTKRLSLLDLSPRLRDHYANAEGRDSANALANALAGIARDIKHADDPMYDRGGVFAFVGPTGVGKTTTIAKLAARFALKHGAKHVALISTDGFRIGAHDQLETYARLIGCSIRTADTPSALHDALDAFVDKRLILIDTAGMSQRDTRLTEQLHLLSQARYSIKLNLVLSACAQRTVLLEAVKHFGQFPLHSAILTKLDEATSLGAVLSSLLESQLPLAASCDGQQVPEDIRVLRGAQLVDRALKLAEQYRESVDEWLLANELKTGELKVGAHAGI